ncbi:predicted protein [Nematostella vectensis]|uniref:Methyltransferase-like protein 22 n=2 Tax=Nematostella vectensis TaxID=45351 RepID=A7SLE1_NEMVE|nr:predicted protein [Nematostella vectensis]|eukprot:XP_001627575.1 predicted protein [Nematostella vectensis]
MEYIKLIVAADVIYDDDLTDAFLSQILCLFASNSSRVVLLALEKRLNFTLEYLDVACPAYIHFTAKLRHLQQQGLLFTRQLPLDFPNYIQYDRVRELELWEIKPR